ncbi:cache domain-containing sensor histidine kinase [Cohnella zeiphila]|uniref:Sensor histidine kinase n=1 Tax=Cohnella zeiphila TaxID=2761120 RepID=A0A7X0SL93_9BACL|nr:sensor histidine kinase [Cohnella zeiphila]MBB6732092.1 sensor histidine kinase [Cohnella zeiphila]
MKRRSYRMLGWFRDRTLRMKLFICICLFIIVPLMAAGLLLNKHFSRVTLNKSSEVALQTLLQTKKNIDFVLAGANDLSVAILSNDTVQRFLRGEYANDVEYDSQYKAIADWMSDIVGSKEYYDSVSISRDGNILFRRGTYEPSVNAAMERRAVGLMGEAIWTGAERETVDDRQVDVVSLYRDIIDFNHYGRSLGVIKINIREQAIEELSSTANAYVGEERFILDLQGRVLSSKEKELIGRNIGDQAYISRALREGQGHFIADVDGAPRVVLFFTIGQPGWVFVQSIPVSAIAGNNGTHMVVIVAVALCLLFGMLFSLVQHHYLIRPLVRLLKEMSKLKRGNFDVSLASESRDEIGEITRSFMKMSEELKKTINTVYLSQIKQREAELTALQAQINPHFLYNTLDSIRWLAMKSRNYEVSDQIEALSEIFKHVLNKGQPLVTVGSELEFLRNYMFIQEAKYGNRIRLVIQASPELYPYKCPKLILQPLVENALIHGMGERTEGGLVEVAVERKEFGIQYTVTDNGVGTDGEAINGMLAEKGVSPQVFALRNIDERIKLNYGEGYGLFFYSRLSQGTRVEVRLPLIG